MAGGVNDVKQHRWFKQIVWTDIIEQKIQVVYNDKISFNSLFFFIATNRTES